MKIKNIIVFLGDVDFCIDIFKIFESSDEMFNIVIIGRLFCFRKVFFFRRDVAFVTGV